ncbi:class I SAM-dependent methyltransferase [Stigmatella sp. ncwal1]|uniref:Class I SAM-dependent methyltransferase n=1 Tax=Stigmatella ashevillensis TaxID=2995309 RepID=A0ABT5D404_9BACT|nr:class I SAM-dependent methyltransferase [Stigmatella ashevillena]MDC0707769.1 class I SAM-dependent methyltransferase [Stigmatella ashevillena]
MTCSAAVSPGGTFLYLTLLALLLGGMLSIVFFTLRTGISPMPTSARVRRELLKLLPPDLEGTVLELGSGWGTLAFALADACPRAQVVGFELSPLPYAFGWLRQRLAPRRNLRFVRRDFSQVSFAGASLAVCYLFPEAMRRLAPKLAAELPPGAFILSHTFALRGWTPYRTAVAADLYRTPIYLYAAPGNAPRKIVQSVQD